jgi:hypothetical protein
MIGARFTIPRARAVCGVGALSMLLGACGGGGDKGPTAPVQVLTTVTVQLQSWIVVGETVPARVSGYDQNGVPMTVGAVTWSTAPANVATVSIYGTVTGAAPGQTLVIATARGKQGQQSLTVIPVPVTAVAVSPATATLTVGATLQLSAAALDQDGYVLTGRVISWASSDTAKVTVSASGLVTAVSPGNAHVFANSEGQSGLAVITVSPR